MKVKQFACERLLAQRVETKLRSKSASDIFARIHVAQPTRRDNKVRDKSVPENYAGPLGKMEETGEPQGVISYGHLEGPGDDYDPTKYSEDLRQHYLLSNDDWKFDPIPEIMDGYNVADFVDPHIAEMMELLEEEEGRRIEALQNDMEEEEEFLTPEQAATAEAVLEHKKMVIVKSRAKHIRNHPRARRVDTARIDSASNLESHLKDLGIDPSKAVKSVREHSRSRGRSASSKKRESLEGVTVLGKRKRSASASRDRSASTSEAAHKKKMQKVTDKTEKQLRRSRMKTAHVTEADRFTTPKLIKHLNSGKRGAGKTDRR